MKHSTHHFYGMGSRLIAFVLTLACTLSLFSFIQTERVDAASKTQSYSLSYDVLYASGGFKCLDVYGRDSFALKVDTKTKKIVSSSAKQTAKALGTKMIY